LQARVNHTRKKFGSKFIKVSIHQIEYKTQLLYLLKNYFKPTKEHIFIKRITRLNKLNIEYVNIFFHYQIEFNI